MKDFPKNCLIMIGVLVVIFSIIQIGIHVSPAINEFLIGVRQSI